MMFTAEGILARRPGSGRKSVITDEVRRIVEEQMRHDDETTASQLHIHLTSLGYTLNLQTAGRLWGGHLEEVPTASSCRMSKSKRLDLARDHRSDNFADMIITDECSVQLESHRRRCCHKQGEPARNKQS